MESLPVGWFDPCPECLSNKRHPTLAYIIHDSECLRRRLLTQ